jgi:sialic acid synthase SpsE
MRLKFIAEIGLNHNGNFDLNFELIRQAKYSGANIVKFQLGWRGGETEINFINEERVDKLIKWCNYF